jgi:hypothetical protein
MKVPNTSCNDYHGYSVVREAKKETTSDIVIIVHK